MVGSRVDVMKAWEVIAIIILLGILVFMLYWISSLDIIPSFAIFFQRFMLKIGSLLKFDKIINFISEIVHISK